MSSHVTEFEIHGVGARVECEVPFHAARLKEDFAPFLTRLTREPDVMVLVSARDSTRTQAELPNEVGMCRVRGLLGDEIAWSDDGQMSILGSGVAQEASYIHEVRSYFAAWVLQRVMRARLAQQVHASAVRGARGGVLFAGEKKSGKTSLALLAVSAGSGYVANDIALLDCSRTAVDILGLPQSLTLGPGAATWFAQKVPQLGIAPPALEGAYEGEALFNLEGTEKTRVRCEHLGPEPGPVPLTGLLFPEVAVWLTKPRARPLSSDEAFVRLVNSAEAISKWSLPPALLGDDYLDRLQRVCRAAVSQADSWHFQWCLDHSRNLELMREIAL